MSINSTLEARGERRDGGLEEKWIRGTKDVGYRDNTPCVPLKL
jgi:hypothetical protein